MEHLVMEGSSSTPAIDCNPEGKITISGRSLPENPLLFYQPLMNWAKAYDGGGIEINIRLEYFNTSTSKVLHDFFKLFVERPKMDHFNINWFYEEGDEDSLESGEIYQDEIEDATFSFIEFAEA